MFQAVPSPYVVPFDGSFRLGDQPTTPPDDGDSRKKNKKRLGKLVERFDDLQRVFYAADRCSLLLIFQAMDAAGKDSTIRSVFSGVNPAGFQVYSFKKPSDEELDHDFLWRTTRSLPERGRIGVFNRSYYEEVLVVRVHPSMLGFQKLPEPIDEKSIWKERFRSIGDHEQHLARNGTVILKFWLNVSQNEQKRRFLSRIEEPEKNWKFSAGDIKERGHWESYMAAYEEALAATSKPWAPWYAIPADDKPFMRAEVANIVVQTLESLGLQYPELGDKELSRLDEMRRLLGGSA